MRKSKGSVFGSFHRSSNTGWLASGWFFCSRYWQQWTAGWGETYVVGANLAAHDVVHDGRHFEERFVGDGGVKRWVD